MEVRKRDGKKRKRRGGSYSEKACAHERARRRVKTSERENKSERVRARKGVREREKEKRENGRERCNEPMRESLCFSTMNTIQ